MGSRGGHSGIPVHFSGATSRAHSDSLAGVDSNPGFRALPRVGLPLPCQTFPACRNGGRQILSVHDLLVITSKHNIIFRKELKHQIYTGTLLLPPLWCLKLDSLLVFCTCKCNFTPPFLRVKVKLLFCSSGESNSQRLPSLLFNILLHSN